MFAASSGGARRIPDTGKKGPHALQDPLIEQPADNTNDKTRFAAGALQDALIMQASVLVGLIVQLTGRALQGPSGAGSS